MTLVNILVAVELPDADVEQCNAFDAAMAARRWAKIPRVAALYCAAIEGASSDADALEIAQKSIDESAGQSGILLWDGVCVISDSAPTSLRQSPGPSNGDE